MTKILVIIVIIAVAVGGYFMFRGKAPVAEKEQETPSNTVGPNLNGIPIDDSSAKMETGIIDQTAGDAVETVKNVTVTYTDSGFSPKTVTIKKGGSVTFINQSSGNMWIASNPHPIHTDYPVFDEKATVSKDGSWSFTFDKVGTWSYHNHLNSPNTGTVVVE